MNTIYPLTTLEEFIRSWLNNQKMISNFLRSLHFGYEKLKDMSMEESLSIQPSELKFPFKLRKQSSCSVNLVNRSDQYVAFKVKTTQPKKYCVRPCNGVIMPDSVCEVTVIMQAPKEAPPDMKCRDKFLIQAVVAPIGTTSKNLTKEMFMEGEGKKIQAFKLRVVYITPKSATPSGVDESRFDAKLRHQSSELKKNTNEKIDALTKICEEQKKTLEEQRNEIQACKEQMAEILHLLQMISASNQSLFSGEDETVVEIKCSY